MAVESTTDRSGERAGLGDLAGTPPAAPAAADASEVFHGDIGALTRIRREYRWYPTDIWRWLIASQWHLIGTTTPFLGRTLEVGDVQGARLTAGRPCRLIMEMAFLLERKAINDPVLRNLARAGGIDQLTHVDDPLINFSTWPKALADCYRTIGP